MLLDVLLWDIIGRQLLPWRKVLKFSAAELKKNLYFLQNVQHHNHNDNGNNKTDF